MNERPRVYRHSRKQLVNSRFPAYFTDPEHAQAGVANPERAPRDRVRTHPDHPLRPAHHRVVQRGVLRDTAGNLLGILAAARDITEQKRLEEQLPASQIYTRSLIESNIDALMTTDPLGIITDVNQQMGRSPGARAKS